MRLVETQVKVVGAPEAVIHASTTVEALRCIWDDHSPDWPCRQADVRFSFVIDL
jgi:hypothetical protein